MDSFERRRLYKAIRLGVAGIKRQADTQASRSEAQANALQALHERHGHLSKLNAEFFYKQYLDNIRNDEDKLTILRNARAELIKRELQPTTTEEYAEYKVSYDMLMDALLYYMERKSADTDLAKRLKYALRNWEG